MIRVSKMIFVCVLCCLPIFAGSLNSVYAGDEATMEAVGGLTGAYVYQLYLNIGLVGDGVAKKCMEPEAGKQILGSVLRVADVIDSQIDKMTKSNIADDDKKQLGEFRSVIALLKTQGSELEKFWETKEEEHGKKYETARTSAWEKIKTLLGIKD